MAYRRRKPKNTDNELVQLLFGDEPITKNTPPAAKKDEPEVLSVTQLTEWLRFAIKNTLPTSLIVAGEISNLTYASSGHIYFTLKDNQSQIACAMWKSKTPRLKFRLADGQAVLVHGCVDIYGPRGQYQLYAEKITPSGMGELELAFRQMKEKLEKEGLFDPAHKKPIPAYPLTIAVITSPTGAAIRDILRTLELRWPVGRVLLYPVAVQGESAAPEIVQAIKDLNAKALQFKIDVVILARGGGSLEDLWAFNEEIVARAIYSSKLPIISGVGHEIDITIADLVADLRAATPTAAAQHATPVLGEVMDSLRWHYNRLKTITLKNVAMEKQLLVHLANRPMFRNPQQLLGSYAQQLDEGIHELSRIIETQLKLSRSQVHNTEMRLNRISPNVLISKANYTIVKLEQRLATQVVIQLSAKKRGLADTISKLHQVSPREKSLRGSYNLSALEDRLAGGLKRLMKDKSTGIDHLESRLAGCDYKRVLKRGFSLARRASDGRVLTSSDLIAENEEMITELSDGRIRSVVKAKEK
jgi:exodeoxyribonuclease VII large subunit